MFMRFSKQEIDTSASTIVGDLSSLELFKLKVSDFCQRITNPKAPISFPESPIIQLKTQHSSSPFELVKPTFTPGEVQELKDILQQFLNLDFEQLVEGDLKVYLEICCQAAWVLKPASQDLHKQLLTKISEFQIKAYQLCEVQERHLQRQSLKAALSTMEDEARSVVSSYDQDAIKLYQLQKEEAQLEATLLNVKGEIAQTTANMQVSLNKASSFVADTNNLKSQLQRTTDQEEIYDFVCTKGAHILSDLKDTIVQFFDR
jgi:hypothetical protein